MKGDKVQIVTTERTKIPFNTVLVRYRWWIAGISAVLITVTLVTVYLVTAQNVIGRDTPEGMAARYDSINLLVAQEKYDEALSKIEVFIDKAENDNVKKEAYLLSSSIYYAQGDFETALNEAQKADNLVSDYATVASMASCAAAAGRTDIALEYFEMQERMLDPQDPMYESNKHQIQSDIDALGVE